jgi:hypothetical protein
LEIEVMHFIIESEEQLAKLQHKDSCFVHAIPLNDDFHPTFTDISCVYYNDGEKGYILCVDHSESFSLQKSLVIEFLRSHKKVYCLDLKYHLQILGENTNLVDLYYNELNHTGRVEERNLDTIAHVLCYRNNPNYERVNCIIPIAKHYEKYEAVYDNYKTFMKGDSDITRVAEAYSYAECNGMFIDNTRFVETYQIEHPEFLVSPNDGRARNKYNLYNVTGRPTNSFCGVNFLAVPKDEEHRSIFKSAYGKLVEFDFDAYHLRLIANHIGFDLPKEPVHQYLAKHYFNTEEITEEMYKQSKTISFRQMYGGVEEEYKRIPFFEAMGKMIEDLWIKYESQGYLELPTGLVLRKNRDLNKLKVFNYYVQNLETEENVKKITQLRSFLSDKKTRLILISYDAFLFDYSIEDGKGTLLCIKKILEKNNTLTKHKHGDTYNF